MRAQVSPPIRWHLLNNTMSWTTLIKCQHLMTRIECTHNMMSWMTLIKCQHKLDDTYQMPTFDDMHRMHTQHDELDDTYQMPTQHDELDDTYLMRSSGFRPFELGFSRLFENSWVLWKSLTWTTTTTRRTSWNKLLKPRRSSTSRLKIYLCTVRTKKNGPVFPPKSFQIQFKSCAERTAHAKPIWNSFGGKTGPFFLGPTVHTDLRL